MRPAPLLALVSEAKKRMRVVTSEEIVEMAEDRR